MHRSASLLVSDVSMDWARETGSSYAYKISDGKSYNCIFFILLLVLNGIKGTLNLDLITNT